MAAHTPAKKDRDAENRSQKRRGAETRIQGRFAGFARRGRKVDGRQDELRTILKNAEKE